MVGGVLQQVHQGLGQPLRIRPQRGATDAGHHAHPVSQDGLCLGRHGVQETVQRQRLQLEQSPVVRPGEGGQVFHQPAHQGQFVHAHGLDGAHLPLVGSLFQHLQMAPADREGGSQLMRHRRQEPVLHLIQLTKPLTPVSFPRQSQLNML